MKRNLNLNGTKVLKIAVVLLIMTMITGILVSNTVAKYTTSFTGSDTARVAKFSVSATGITTGSVALFATSYGSTAVVNGGTDKVIAPGTTGSIIIKFTNNSEVPVALSGVTLSETNADSIPIVYSVDGTNYYAAGPNLNAALSAALGTATIAVGASSSSVNLNWKWVFYVDAAGDTADTAFGVDTTPATVTTTIAVTASQVQSA
jgi:hypothetical protein